MLAMFVTRSELCVFAPQTARSQQPAVSLCGPAISHLTLTLVCWLDLAVDWFELWSGLSRRLILCYQTPP